MRDRGPPGVGRKVFFAGEGRTELGSYAGHPSYWSSGDVGVLPALIAKVQPAGWRVEAARTWMSIRKLRVGRADHEDTRNVAAVALDAREAGCDVLVFSRDRDGDERRQAAVEEGISRVKASGGPDVVGGIATPAIEGWLLALKAERGTESLSRADAKDRVSKDGRGPVGIVEEWNLREVAPDATSLTIWLERARQVFVTG